MDHVCFPPPLFLNPLPSALASNLLFTSSDFSALRFHACNSKAAGNFAMSREWKKWVCQSLGTVKVSSHQEIAKTNIKAIGVCCKQVILCFCLLADLRLLRYCCTYHEYKTWDIKSETFISNLCYGKVPGQFLTADIISNHNGHVTIVLNVVAPMWPSHFIEFSQSKVMDFTLVAWCLKFRTGVMSETPICIKSSDFLLSNCLEKYVKQYGITSGSRNLGNGMGRGKKHEIWATIFGSHLFYDYFILVGEGRQWPPCPRIRYLGLSFAKVRFDFKDIFQEICNCKRVVWTGLKKYGSGEVVCSCLWFFLLFLKAVCGLLLRIRLEQLW